MRLQLYGWAVLTCLWTTQAAAIDTNGQGVDPFAGITDCAEVLEVLQAHPALAVANETRVDAICEGQSETPRHDAVTQARLDEWHRGYMAAVDTRVRELLIEPDARSQLAAALIGPTLELAQPGGQVHDFTSEQSTAAFAAARRLGPDDALVAWLEAMGCPRTRALCDSAGGLDRLKRLDPDNAAVWTLAMQGALERQDSASVDRYLARAARAESFGGHVGEITRLLYEVLSEASAPPIAPDLARAMSVDVGQRAPATVRDVASVSAMAIGMAQVLPALQPLNDVCVGSAEVPAAPHRAADCIALYTLLANSRELLFQQYALTGLVLMTAGRPEGNAWRERLRKSRWIMEHGVVGMSTKLESGSAYLESWLEVGEAAALEQMLLAAGEPATPSPGWLPSDDRGRALITTGQLPQN